MFNLPIKRKRDTVGEWNEWIVTIKGVISIFQIGMDYIELVWLSQHSTTEIFSVVIFEGARKVRRNVTHYNLDAILSAGYRVSSRNATLFRRWATAVLKAIESTLAEHQQKIDLFHCGHSIKDMGKKLTAIMLMGTTPETILNALE